MLLQNILQDFQPQDEFAADTRRVRAHRREVPPPLLGMPWALWGGKVHIYLPGAREWLAARIRRRAPARAS